MRCSTLLVLAAPLVAAQQVSDIVNGVTGVIGDIGTGVGNIVSGATGAGVNGWGAVTSIGDGVLTIVTGAISDIGSIATGVTTIGGSVYTIATGAAGSAVPTVTATSGQTTTRVSSSGSVQVASTTSRSSTGGAAMITNGPMLAAAGAGIFAALL